MLNGYSSDDFVRRRCKRALAEERGEEQDLNRQEKETFVAEFHEKLAQARAAVVTDYRGLKVAQITELRQRLKEARVEYHVVKNTLTRLAAQGTAASALVDHLNGPCALALGYDDELAPARLLMDYAKKNDKLEVKAGVMVGRLMGAEQIKELIRLPSKQELHAQLLGTMARLPSKFLGVMAAVPGDFLNVLAATPRNLVGVLRAIEQKGSQPS
ncbi:MAG: 50S ribosomal protein L10 [Syntrophobacteria bacterium]